MRRWLMICTWILPAGLAVIALATLALSINHPISADLAMLHYCGYLMNEKDFVLYRDIFEINFPAPFLLHQFLGQLLGYEALPLRLLDFATLAFLGVCTWKIISPISRRSAIFASGLFILLYDWNGNEFSLERDYLGVLPIALAFALNSTRWKNSLLAATVTGLLCALACSIKPNFIVAMPVLLWMLWRNVVNAQNNKTWKIGAGILTVFGCTFTTIFLLPFLWIYHQGGLPDFIHLYKTYLPIYAFSRYDMFHYNNMAEYWQHIRQQYFIFGGLSMLLSAPALLWARTLYPATSAVRNRMLPLFAMTFSFTLYEVIAGKFWLSHMLPSAYWTVLCFSLLITPAQAMTKIHWHVISCVIAISISFALWPFTLFTYNRIKEAHTANQNTSQANVTIAQYLQQNLQANDTVQILDYAGDGQAVLLAARATSATRFLIDVPLYMQPQSAATQAIRKEFIQTLQAKPPAFVVYFDRFLHVGGGNRLKEFTELDNFITRHYEKAAGVEGEYSIFKLNDQALGNVTPR